MANSKSITVRDILSQHISEVHKDMTYKSKVKLTQRIRTEIKAFIGHGVSQEYYDKVWKYDVFKPQHISGHIINAFNKRGAYSNENMFGKAYTDAVARKTKQH